MRNISLDVTRIIALYFVISVHFFLNNGFYDQLVIGERMYVATVCRSTFMVCVPLFIVLSGYLMNKKIISKSYYLGLGKTLGVYILASIACIVFKSLYLDMEYTLKTALLSIMNFSAANYAWYVEMYIGLYLLIPFLNKLYHSLNSKKEKQLLVGSLIVLAALPGIANILCEVVPNWWLNIYPLMYYFIGCYLREYGLKIKIKTNLLLFIISVIVIGSMNYCLSYGSTFIWGIWEDYGAFPNMWLTVLLFNLLVNINFSFLPVFFKECLAKLSNWSFGAYLVSYIFDMIFYPYLNEMITEMPLRLEWYVIIVPLVFVCSLILSAGLNMLYTMCTRVITKICSKI